MTFFSSGAYPNGNFTSLSFFRAFLPFIISELFGSLHQAPVTKRDFCWTFTLSHQPCLHTIIAKVVIRNQCKANSICDNKISFIEILLFHLGYLNLAIQPKRWKPDLYVQLCICLGFPSFFLVVFSFPILGVVLQMSFVGLIIVVWSYHMTLLYIPHILLEGR